MPDRLGYDPNAPKTPEQIAQAQGALNEAQALVDKEDAAKAEAMATGSQNIEIPNEELDEFEKGMDDLFGGEDNG